MANEKCESCDEDFEMGIDEDTGEGFPYCPNGCGEDPMWGADETPDYPMYEG